eukprot:TRINITY_DN1402_c0_g1_i1.p1 TRINITY_DN1402_c0_g1~~TRINITY_DN1402_c0_g1_i1.p1  ORF type:complete len:288 (-),score=73.56 TRINITY_DN1402_c0_g1_i1:649-1512(-)
MSSAVHSLSKEDIIQRHSGVSLSSLVDGLDSAPLLLSVTLRVRNRSDDRDTLGSPATLSIFRNVAVISHAEAKHMWAYSTHLPLDASTNVVRTACTVVGLTTTAKCGKARPKYLFSCDDEPTLIRVLQSLRAAAAGADSVEDAHLTPIDNTFGYLPQLIESAGIDDCVYEEHWISNERGQRLYSHLFVPKGAPVTGICAVVSGFSDSAATLWSHNCLHRDTLLIYLKRGLAVVSHDHVGHGRSDGMPMFVSHFEDELVADAAHTIAELRKTCSGTLWRQRVADVFAR